MSRPIVMPPRRRRLGARRRQRRRFGSACRAASGLCVITQHRSIACQLRDSVDDDHRRSPDREFAVGSSRTTSAASQQERARASATRCAPAGRQRAPAAADDRVVAVGQRADEHVGAGQRRRVAHRRVGPPCASPSRMSGGDACRRRSAGCCGTHAQPWPRIVAPARAPGRRTPTLTRPVRRAAALAEDERSPPCSCPRRSPPPTPASRPAPAPGRARSRAAPGRVRVGGASTSSRRTAARSGLGAVARAGGRGPPAQRLEQRRASAPRRPGRRRSRRTRRPRRRSGRYSSGARIGDGSAPACSPRPPFDQATRRAVAPAPQRDAERRRQLQAPSPDQERCTRSVAIVARRSRSPTSATATVCMRCAVERAPRRQPAQHVEEVRWTAAASDRPALLRLLLRARPDRPPWTRGRAAASASMHQRGLERRSAATYAEHREPGTMRTRARAAGGTRAEYALERRSTPCTAAAADLAGTRGAVARASGCCVQPPRRSAREPADSESTVRRGAACPPTSKLPRRHRTRAARPAATSATSAPAIAAGAAPSKTRRAPPTRRAGVASTASTAAVADEAEHRRRPRAGRGRRGRAAAGADPARASPAHTGRRAHVQPPTAPEDVVGPGPGRAGRPACMDRSRQRPCTTHERASWHESPRSEMLRLFATFGCETITSRASRLGEQRPDRAAPPSPP